MLRPLHLPAGHQALKTIIVNTIIIIDITIIPHHLFRHHHSQNPILNEIVHLVGDVHKIVCWKRWKHKSDGRYHFNQNSLKGKKKKNIRSSFTRFDEKKCRRVCNFLFLLGVFGHFVRKSFRGRQYPCGPLSQISSAGVEHLLDLTARTILAVPTFSRWEFEKTDSFGAGIPMRGHADAKCFWW